MSLIACPECGREISDRAQACIHCGYPLNAQPLVSNNVPKLKKVAISASGLSSRKIVAIQVICQVTGMGTAAAKALVEQNSPYIIVKDALTPDEAASIQQAFLKKDVYAQVLDSDADTSSAADKIQCPCCGSTQLHTGARGYSIVLGLIGSSQTIITCLKCGHQWKPGK